MLKGKVKSFDEQKGWGFITVPHEGEIFVHYSELKERVVVSFTLMKRSH